MFDAAGMVRFGMVDDDIGYLRRITNLLQFGFVSIPKLFFGRFDHRLFIGIDKIGVIGGAVFGFHYDIKGPEFFIQNPDPINVFFYFNYLIIHSVLCFYFFH